MGMARRRKSLPIIEGLEIIDAASQGKSLGKVDDKVVFVTGVVPGDIVDVQVTKKRKSYLEAKPIKIHEYSKERSEPFCSHFGVCGGCKWQNMDYKYQLKYKEKQVVDQFTRIGHLEVKDWYPILAAPSSQFYRNKLEFTFSNRKWLTIEQIQSEEEFDNRNGLGFHIPGAFDKVVDLEKCYLQADPSNAIRDFIRDYTHKNEYSYFDLRAQEGLMRNLIIRSTSIGELMVIVVFFENDKTKIETLLAALKETFPAITSLMYVINEKKNDSLFDQEIECYAGNDFIVEQLGDLKFKIGPKSFFQTNSEQAKSLYSNAIEFASIRKDDLVYDLYSGTGTISCILAQKAKKVIGVEQIEEAVFAANENAKINNIDNTVFVAGDTKDVLNPRFFKQHGKPDVIVVDPPRAGLHEKVVNEIIAASPDRILYISCNPATQARDLALMKEHYSIEKVQAVDMFPQTHHVENIAYLKRK
jgi:23S rRNA (uracil1939-C5)-methyltransferase